MTPPPLPNTTRSGLSTASLVCGILSLPLCLVPAIPAIITGHIALSQIKASAGLLTGAKAAMAGLILGYASIAAIPVIAAGAGLLAPLVMRQKEKADQAQTTINLRQIGEALFEYGEEHGFLPQDLYDLETSGILPDLTVLLKSPRPGDWLYFPQSPDEMPVLISPTLSFGQSESDDSRYAALYADGSVRLKKESELSPSLAAPDAIRIPAPTR